MATTELQSTHEAQIGEAFSRESADLESDGFVMVRNVLSAEEVAELNLLIDRILEEEGQPNSLNIMAAVFKYPELLPLLEQPPILELVVNLLGYNLQLHSSSISVRKPVPAEWSKSAFAGGSLPAGGNSSSPSLNWHRDGPSPRFPHVETYSAKACFILTDLTKPDQGNTKVIPGSHKERGFMPDHGDPNAPVKGETQVIGAPGDAFIFAQNLWHAAALNRSSVERRLIFIGYGSCWSRPLDYETVPSSLREGRSPVLRQLLGEVGPTPLHHYMPDSMPLQKYWRGGEVVHGYAKDG